MSGPIPVLVAVTGRWEALLVAQLGRIGGGVVVVRRCPDLADLLAVAATGQGRAAVVSADLRSLGGDALSRLALASVAVVALVEPGDEGAVRRLHQLGVRHVLSADTPAEHVAEAIRGAVAGDAAEPADSSGRRSAPGSQAPGASPGWPEAVAPDPLAQGWAQDGRDPTGMPDGRTVQRPAAGGRVGKGRARDVRGAAGTPDLRTGAGAPDGGARGTPDRGAGGAPDGGPGGAPGGQGSGTPDRDAAPRTRDGRHEPRRETPHETGTPRRRAGAGAPNDHRPARSAGTAGSTAYGDPRGALPRRRHDPERRSTDEPILPEPDGRFTPDSLVIAVWGPAGAPGRTTTALGLAAEVADRGGSCLLVDADTHAASIAQVLGLFDEAPGLASAARAADHGALDVTALSPLAPQLFLGLRVLTGLPSAARWPEIRPASFATVLRVARDLTGCIVVDVASSLEQDEELSYDTAAPRRNGVTLQALQDADLVVAVGSADPVGLQRLVRGLQDLAAVGTASPVVVVNRVRASAVGPAPERAIRRALARYAGVDDPVLVPYDRAGLDLAVLQGRTLVEAAPSSPVRQAHAQLAARVGAVRTAQGPKTARRRWSWSGG